MGLSIWHILVLLLVVLIVFGAGRLPHVMGDLGRGIRSFKEGLSGGTPPSAKESGEERPRIISSDKNDGNQS